uniref:Uncharacterized protein n=1 Tax=Cyprinus carpio TaxID=7962 RepID=A0A8C2B282_CYPCA
MRDGLHWGCPTMLYIFINITFVFKWNRTCFIDKITTLFLTLNNHGVHGASKKNIAASLQFAKDHADKPEGYWRNKRYV